MSGDGVVSGRLPRSLLGTFRATAAQQGISIHEAARRLFPKLLSLTKEELLSLPEPPREAENPRVSLHVGWESFDVLVEISYGTQFCISSIIRRVLYGYLVQNALAFVQRGGQWELQLISQNGIKKIHEKEDDHAAR